MNGSNTNRINSDFLIKVTHNKKKGYYTMPFNHYHAHYEIYYLLSGERNYFIKDRTYSIKKGDLVLINKNDLHKTIDGTTPDHERILIDFKEELLDIGSNDENKILLQPFKMNRPVIRLEIHEQVVIENLLNKMLQEQQLKISGYSICLRAYLYELLVLIYRLMDQQNGMPLETPNKMHQRISEIVQYINSHYNHPLSLNMLSNIFYISPYYLSRLFKEITGFNFVEYLNIIRIREAQKLLQSSELKIIEIAEAVGFGSVAHFGRVFKSITSLSPSDYRVGHKNKHFL